MVEIQRLLTAYRFFCHAGLQQIISKPGALCLHTMSDRNLFTRRELLKRTALATAGTLAVPMIKS